ncbi:MAG: HAMP domain-containing histidine kinase, partial [Bacteroidaceae bacterium]|nr:HAMP domain-containing histidine kinase [Bacteroidaceae bacterium]
MVPSFIPRLFLTLATALLPLFCVAADSASQSAGLYTEAVEAIAVGLITILLLVIIANVLLYFTNRQKRMAHQRIEDATVSAILQQKSKSMYFSNMTHEIRTPLNAIAGFCDLLAEPSVDDDTRKEAANIIAMNSNNFRRLIDDVLQSSSTSSPDNFDFTYVSCDAIKLGRNVVNMLSHINKTDANITFSANKEMFPIVTDSLRLQQVIINVMTNAMKFCKRGTINLNINADDVKNEITFTVTDTGVGIPKDKAKKIFKRFEKVTEQAYGFGIGLSLCKIIMQRLGGDIWVDENYTNGARFVFNQPYVAVENAQGRAGTVNASILLPLLFLAALPPARSIAMTVVLFLGLIALICVLIYALYHRMKSRKLLLEK